MNSTGPRTEPCWTQLVIGGQIRGSFIDNDSLFSIAKAAFDPIVHITCDPKLIDLEH